VIIKINIPSKKVKVKVKVWYLL